MKDKARIDKEELERKKRLEASVYRYYNNNPHHVRTDDCVIRSIAAGTGEEWEKIARDLFDYMLKTGYVIGTPELYGKYLKDIGWVKQKQPVTAENKKVRIKDFVRDFDGHAIIHVGKGHVSYVADGCLWDIWNCENEVIGSYWVPEDELEELK